MNVECQAIRVPTGVQDYRPALYGGIAAIELRVEGIKRVALDVDPPELERRIVLAYTGAPRNSGTNNWEITKRHIDGDRAIFDCFERIRDTAVAMRDALERGDWDEVGRQIANEWDNRKRLAPGVTTPAIEELIAAPPRRARPRRRSAAPAAAAVCSATAPRRRDRRSPQRSPPAARVCSTTASRRKVCGLDNQAIARILREIADLLEIKDDNPFKIRAYRNGADIVANHPHELARLDAAALRGIPGIGKDLAARIRRDRRDRRRRLSPRARRRIPADGSRPAPSAGCRTQNGGDAVSRAGHPDARRARSARATDGRIRIAARHGREERSADPEGARRAEAVRRPAPAAGLARRGGGARRISARSRAGGRSSRRSAACAAAATRAAIWTCWPRAPTRR